MHQIEDPFQEAGVLPFRKGEVHAILLFPVPGKHRLVVEQVSVRVGLSEERRATALKLETQQALLDLDYKIGAVDGMIGANTRAAIRDFQKTHGLPVTGEPSEALLERLREAAQANESAQD